jgi:lysophospholipase L1-like esterase
VTTDVDEADAPPAAERHRPTRSHRPWTTVLGLMAATLALWLVLDATTLQHNSQVSPIGTRRSVALTFLNPLASTTRFLQIADPELLANRLLGRDGNVPGNGRTFTVVGPSAPRSKPGRAPGGVTATTVNTLRGPTATNPLRVLLIGDSLGLDLGGALQNTLATTGVVTATLDGKEATGLTRPDYFDWPLELSSDLATADPQVIVVMMGANDPQDLLGPPDVPFGTLEWNIIYEGRVASFMRLATSRGARLIWVSLPPMQDPGLNAEIAVINELQRSAASQLPGVIYVDSSAVLGSTYSAFVSANGQEANVRTPDGIHITPEGSSLLAAQVVSKLRNKLGIMLP